eukprot:5737488-Prymnesium_polylepis.1
MASGTRAGPCFGPPWAPWPAGWTTVRARVGTGVLAPRGSGGARAHGWVLGCWRFVHRLDRAALHARCPPASRLFTARCPPVTDGLEVSVLGEYLLWEHMLLTYVGGIADAMLWRDR